MKKTVFVFVACMLITLSATAGQPDYIKDGILLDGKTIVKTSVTTPALKTFSFSGERIVNKRISAVLGIGFMPSSTIPFSGKIIDMAGSDDKAGNILSSLRINTFSLSPEVRIYTGNGYGRGFYLSPYYRYERFGLNNFSVEFDLDNQTEEFILSGGVNTHAVGLMIGYQWLVGKNRNIVIDWTMLGAHYGASSGNFNGKYNGNLALTDEDRQKAKKDIDNELNDLPFIKAKGTVNKDNSVDASVKGPWAFLRGGVSVGIRF